MRQTKMNFIPERKWYLIDAEGVVLGRLATQVADILLGRTKVNYTPHLDMGDNVIIINAEKIKLTGRKEINKKYYSHSGHRGALKTKTVEQLREKTPEKIIENAVWGMITHNSLGKKAFKKLHVYAGSHHEHEAQQPVKMTLKYRKGDK